MKLAIFTLVQHSKIDETYYGYGPYVREMNLWGKYVDELLVLGTKSSQGPSKIDAAYDHKKLRFYQAPKISLLSLFEVLRTMVLTPFIFLQCLWIMTQADHIHLRCPANISLVACFAQIFFPRKPKSTKYAGNWDPKSKQPWSYRLQQVILRNRFLTRNMQVLVYGEWPDEPEHVIPFISATYYDRDRVPFKERDYTETLEFVFAASLVPGKRPLLTVQIIEALNKRGYPAVLHMFGDGPLRTELEAYVDNRQIEDQIKLYGNRDILELKVYYQKTHFNILPSKSEGWPKAVAEGMFFGCVPVTTAVSCVPWMLGGGNRGILIEAELESAVATVIHALKYKDLNILAQRAKRWSEQYTFDRLEKEIKMVLQDS